MNKLTLFAKTCQRYTLWITRELSLSKLWLFTLIIGIICIGITHILPVPWKKEPWQSVVIILAALTGVVLATSLFVTTSRGIRAVQERLPWLIPTVAVCFMATMTTLIIREKGITHVWTKFLNELLTPIAYIMLGTFVFALLIYAVMYITRRLRYNKS